MTRYLPFLLLTACIQPPYPQAVHTPITRLEVHPQSDIALGKHILRIPLATDQPLHIEAFSYDTPVIPLFLDFHLTRGHDVAEIRRYSTPTLTLRALKVGTAELSISVGDQSTSLSIIVFDNAPPR